jgi:5-methylcytosine-specific restriction protein A
MAWGSGYRQPGNWQALKAKVLRDADYRCYSPFPTLCTGDAVTADHLISVGEGGTHALSNLAAICEPCHDEKTKQERLRGIARRSSGKGKRRQPERHPNQRATPTRETPYPGSSPCDSVLSKQPSDR